MEELLKPLFFIAFGFLIAWIIVHSSNQTRIDEIELQSKAIRDSALKEIMFYNHKMDSMRNVIDSVQLHIDQVDSNLKENNKQTTETYGKIMGGSADSSYQLILNNLDSSRAD